MKKEEILKAVEEINNEMEGKDEETAKNILFFGMMEKFGFVRTLDCIYDKHWSICIKDGSILISPTVPIDELYKRDQQKKCDNAHKYHRKKFKKLHKFPSEKCN